MENLIGPQRDAVWREVLCGLAARRALLLAEERGIEEATFESAGLAL